MSGQTRENAKNSSLKVEIVSKEVGNFFFVNMLVQAHLPQIPFIELPTMSHSLEFSNITNWMTGKIVLVPDIFFYCTCVMCAGDGALDLLPKHEGGFPHSDKSFVLASEAANLDVFFFLDFGHFLVLLET